MHTLNGKTAVVLGAASRGNMGQVIARRLAAYRARYPLGRIGTVDDIAAAVVWLASDECFLTAQNLQVNGGLTLRGNPSRVDIDASVLAATGKRRPRPWDISEKEEQARL